MQVKSTLITIFIILVLLITAVNAESGFAEQILVQIKHPFYPIENLEINTYLIIWNNATSTFNGKLIYWVTGEKIITKEVEVNITLLPKNSTTISTPIWLVAPGLYWSNVKIVDNRSNIIYTTQSPFNVHPLSDTAIISGTIIALITLIAYLKFKK